MHPKCVRQSWVVLFCHRIFKVLCCWTAFKDEADTCSVNVWIPYFSDVTVISVPDPKPTPAQIAFSIASDTRAGWGLGTRLMSRLLFFSLQVLVRLLSEGGIYFFGKPADINDGWIRYIWVIQWQLLDAVRSKHSLSVLLSAVETSCTTWTPPVQAWWPLSEINCICVHVLHIVAAATIWG